MNVHECAPAPARLHCASLCLLPALPLGPCPPLHVRRAERARAWQRARGPGAAARAALPAASRAQAWRRAPREQPAPEADWGPLHPGPGALRRGRRAP